MEKDLYFSSWTITQLKNQLRNLGLKMSGNKHKLIQRIRENEVRDNRHVFLTDVNDTDYKILLNFNTEDLLNIRETNKYASKLCANKEFLRLRLQRHHSGNANEALIDAATYNDVLFVKYLVENHEVSFSYDNYVVYCKSSYNIERYLIENLDITADDLFSLLKYAATDVGYPSTIHIIKSGLVNKLINKGYNIGVIYDKVINILVKQEQAARYGEVTGDLIESLNKMKHLYETLDTSTYLKMLTDL